MQLANRLTKVLEVFAWVLGVLLVILLTFGIYLYRLSLTLPDLSSDPYASRIARTSLVFAADGSVIADWHGAQDRTVVPYSDLPESLRNAVVAAEDRRFYLHRGVDFESIKAALKGSTSSGGEAKAGSSITQQLVQIMYPVRDRSITHKLKEALLAYELSSKADKKKVLEVYLNGAYFGRGAYGAQAAALRYFGVPAKSLTLSQSATLAGIIRSPSRYGRITANSDTVKRRNQVLDLMAEQGYITAGEAKDAKADTLVFTRSKTDVGRTAPYFVEYVKQELLDRFGPATVYGGGLRVYTSLDPRLQALAEKAAQKMSNPGEPEVAIVSVRPSDGHVVAMVGGKDFNDNQFNLATQARRQPGSAFKTFVLVTALEQGIKPETVFPASPTTITVSDGLWRVQNYENEYTAGSMTLQAATNWSVNGVYARLIMQIGPENVVKTAKAMGITTPLDANPAIALGGLKTGVSPLEMASAYGTLANGGKAVPPTGIVRVTDDSGKLVYRPKQVGRQVVDPQVAQTAGMMLHDTIVNGTALAAKIPEWAAGKTGTTSSYRDAWFVGWSGDLATTVWMGYREGQVAMLNVRGAPVPGGSFPSGIWHNFMIDAVRLKPLVSPALPTPASTPPTSVPSASLVPCTLCQDSLMLATPRCPRTVVVDLAPNLVPKAYCTLH